MQNVCEVDDPCKMWLQICTLSIYSDDLWSRNYHVMAYDWPRLYCTYGSFHMCSLFQAKYYITLYSLNDQTQFELLSDILIPLFNFSKSSAILQKFYVAAAA